VQGIAKKLRYFNLVKTKVKAFNMHSAHAFLPPPLPIYFSWFDVYMSGPRATHISMKFKNLKAFPPLEIPRQPKWSDRQSHFRCQFEFYHKTKLLFKFSDSDRYDQQNVGWPTAVGVANWISDQIALGPILTALCVAELSQMRSTRMAIKIFHKFKDPSSEFSLRNQKFMQIFVFLGAPSSWAPRIIAGT